MSVMPDENLTEVFRLLRERAGMHPESMGSQGVAHAVRKRIAATGESSPHDYSRRLLLDTAEFQELLEELVVPETWFFRDLLAFRQLDRDLSARRSQNRGTVRVLSVGCSTGEEAYSLAIALREAGFAPPEFHLLAVDLSRRALQRAREGRFNSRSFRERDPAIRVLCERWCVLDGVSRIVRDELREGVEFRWGNLAQAEFLAGEPPYHVIFCRNMLIYFHAEARAVAVGHLRRLLSPEGWLCSAPAEARIFAEAGLTSLGGECPFAFRLQAQAGQASPTAPVATRFSMNPRPPSGSAGRLPPVPSDAPAPRLSLAAVANGKEVLGPEMLETAQQAADDGRLDEADAFCGRILAKDPASAEAHYLQGVVRQARGMWAEAQRSLEKVLYLNPRHYQALVHLMLLAEQRGDKAAAANFRRRAQQVAPGEAEPCDPR